MTNRVLFGMETEYAIGQGRPRPAWDLPRVARVLLDAVRSGRHPYLPDGNGGMGVFLANGARLYLDCGCHPEFATPECDDPWQVVGYARAGDLLLEELLRDARHATPMAEAAVLFRSSVDYSRVGATWGCHESYLHACDPRILPDHMTPHLVSRMIYAGAGGFHPMAPGLEFTLSPRAWLLSTATAGGSTSQRGIFHLKDEPLAGHPWHRMHVISGESLCSPRAGVLKVGTTALVLAIVDAGWRSGVQLASSVEALRTIAADPTCRATVRLADGRRVSAVEVQRYYLRQVEDFHRRGRLPEWAGVLCAMWRETLDAIERGDWTRLRDLDWVLKLELYRDRARRHGCDWDSLRPWSRVMRRLERAALRLFIEPGPARADVLAEHPGFHRALDRLSPLMRAAGVAWSDARTLFRLRHELLEADLRFGQLGSEGVFNELARLGHVSLDAGRQLEDPRWLMDRPPPRGRARVRGEAVRALWSQGDVVGYRAEWSGISELGTFRHLDLRDPFCERAEWSVPVARLADRAPAVGA